MTERLYYADAYLTEFDARVESCEAVSYTHLDVYKRQKPFSSPSFRERSRYSGRTRPVMYFVNSTDTGTVTANTSTSTGEMRIIMMLSLIHI